LAEFKLVFGVGYLGRRTRLQRKLQQVRDNHQMHDTAGSNVFGNEADGATIGLFQINPERMNCIYASLLIKR